MSEKRQYSARLNVIEVQITDLKLSIRSHEAKQQDHAVPITVNGMGAHSAKPGQVVREVFPQAGSEAIRRRELHRCPPFCLAAGTTNLPKELLNRRLAADRRPST